MECDNIREKLSSYIDGIIPPEERMLIDEHLKTCERCNESLADLKKTLEYVQNLEDIEPPAWMTQKVMEGIKAEAKPKIRNTPKTLLSPSH